MSSETRFNLPGVLSRSDFHHLGELGARGDFNPLEKSPRPASGYVSDNERKQRSILRNPSFRVEYQRRIKEKRKSIPREPVFSSIIFRGDNNLSGNSRTILSSYQCTLPSFTQMKDKILSYPYDTNPKTGRELRKKIQEWANSFFKEVRKITEEQINGEIDQYRRFWVRNRFDQEKDLTKRQVFDKHLVEECLAAIKDSGCSTHIFAQSIEGFVRTLVDNIKELNYIVPYVKILLNQLEILYCAAAETGYLKGIQDHSFKGENRFQNYLNLTNEKSIKDSCFREVIDGLRSGRVDLARLWCHEKVAHLSEEIKKQWHILSREKDISTRIRQKKYSLDLSNIDTDDEIMKMVRSFKELVSHKLGKLRTLCKSLEKESSQEKVLDLQTEIGNIRSTYFGNILEQYFKMKIQVGNRELSLSGKECSREDKETFLRTLLLLLYQEKIVDRERLDRFVDKAVAYLSQFLIGSSITHSDNLLDEEMVGLWELLAKGCINGWQPIHMYLRKKFKRFFSEELSTDFDTSEDKCARVHFDIPNEEISYIRWYKTVEKKSTPCLQENSRPLVFSWCVKGIIFTSNKHREGMSKQDNHFKIMIQDYIIHNPEFRELFIEELTQ